MIYKDHLNQMYKDNSENNIKDKNFLKRTRPELV